MTIEREIRLEANYYLSILILNRYFVYHQHFVLLTSTRSRSLYKFVTSKMNCFIKISAYISNYFILALLLCNGLVEAQDYLDLARLSYTLTPDSQFDNGKSGPSLNEFNLQLDLPIVLDEKNAFITSFSTNILNTPLHPDQTDRTHLYAFFFRFGLNKIYNETWSGTYLVIPKLTTDFSSGLRTGYQIGFVALVNQKKSSRLKFTYGLYTNTEEFGQLLVPLLGGYYLSEDGKWELTALMPALLDLNRKISERFNLGFNYDGIGTTYSIDNEFYDDSYLSRGSTQFYTYGQYRLTSNLFLRAKLGYDIRSYKIFDEDDKVGLSLASIYFGNNRIKQNIELKDNVMFKLEFFYRFNLPKEKAPVLNDKL